MIKRRAFNILGLLWIIFGILLNGTALAAETWTTDPKTGIRIGWSADEWTLLAASWSGSAVEGKADGRGLLEVTVRYKDGKTTALGKGEVGMLGGLLDGKASIRWGENESFEGEYKKGRREGFGIYKFINGDIYEGAWSDGVMEGKGLYRFKDGRIYEGDFSKNAANGYGIGKDANGKVVHDGQWKDWKPVTPLKADKVLGIPWGATEEQIKSVMKLREKTSYVPYFNGKDGNNRWLYFFGPFADFPEAWIYVYLYQEKMWQVRVSWPLKEDEVLNRFDALKAGLTQRYGSPGQEQGKYLDTLVWWDLGELYYAHLRIIKNTIKLSTVDPTPQNKPFRVEILYYNKAVSDVLFPSSSSGGGTHKDY